MLLLKHTNRLESSEISLSSSKSETNRALLIQALTNNHIILHNVSNARDSITMKGLLDTQPSIWNVKDAGTTMRFCTAFLAIYGNEVTITGTERMQERPIGILVDALKKLGAEIDYLKKEGYPPLSINRITKQVEKTIEVPGNVSSQYISALLMIGPTLPKGIELVLTTEIFSRSYIEMTLALMSHFGITYNWSGYRIQIEPQAYQSGEFTIESDWSGASYWYSLVALNPNLSIKLLGLKEQSTQGDRIIAELMKEMGVESVFEDDGVRIKSTGNYQKEMEIDFKTCPDLAQTVMVAAGALGIRLKMTGLESLKIKETDRIYAMQTELRKMNAELTEEGSVWYLTPGQLPGWQIELTTYEDHRMAMAFAPLCTKLDLLIDDPSVVQKSYPGFWDDLRKVGVQIN